MLVHSSRVNLMHFIMENMIHMVSKNTPLIVRVIMESWWGPLATSTVFYNICENTDYVRSQMKCLWQAGSPTTACKQKHKSPTLRANTVPCNTTDGIFLFRSFQALHDFSFIKQKKQPCTKPKFLLWATTREHWRSRVSTSRVDKLLHNSNPVFFFIDDSRFSGVPRCV